MSGAVRTVTVTVDAISEGIAVLETPSGTIRLPAALLPDGAAEGTKLTLALSVDPGATARAQDEIRALRASMTRGPGSAPPDSDVTEI